MKQIRDNLDCTINTMRSSIVKLSHRGAQIDDISDISERLLASSDLFVTRTLPWYRRCWRFFFVCPSWWFRRRQRDDTLELKRNPWVIV